MKNSKEDNMLSVLLKRIQILEIKVTNIEIQNRKQNKQKRGQY